MGFKETRAYFKKYISRSALVALSALPPGVINCVCVCVCTVVLRRQGFPFLKERKPWFGGKSIQGFVASILCHRFHWSAHLHWGRPLWQMGYNTWELGHTTWAWLWIACAGPIGAISDLWLLVSLWFWCPRIYRERISSSSASRSGVPDFIVGLRWPSTSLLVSNRSERQDACHFPATLTLRRQKPTKPVFCTNLSFNQDKKWSTESRWWQSFF